MNLARNSLRCSSLTLALVALVFVIAGFSLLYAQSHHGSGRGHSRAVAKALSPSPTPTPVSEVIPKFEEVIIADQIRTGPPADTTTVTTNANARDSHRVGDLQAAFLGLDGSDVEVAVFDNGPIRATHKEFRVDINNEATSRIRFRVQPPPTDVPDQHATHVAGTLGAAGNTNHGRVKGMAPALKTIYSENMRQDFEGLAALNGRANISNHSYTPNAGWFRDSRSGKFVWYGEESVDPNEDLRFGKYTDKEARFDDVIYSSKKLLVFAAAGNDRKQSPEAISFESQPVDHYVYDTDNSGQRKPRSVHGVKRKPDGLDSGLDTVVGICVAKNSICIGAIPDIPSALTAASLENIESASYSNWGPTDDGRIKPDLVATGNDLLSTSEADDEAVRSDSGTSMASPTAAGIAALLIQLYRRERGGEDPFAAGNKAVLIHTARDAGLKGPDPVFGWGAIDALAAGRVIGEKDRHIILRRAVSASNPTYELFLEPSNTNDQIKVTLVWTDPPGTANTQGLDDSTPSLMNDLDVKLTAPDGTTVFYPYSLNRKNPLELSVRTEANHVDNVEVIDAVGSTPGRWKLEIKAASFKAGSDQDFALVISGFRPPSAP